MNCRERQHDIILFLYDELTEPVRGELRQHMDGCAPCRQFADAERQLHSRLTGDFAEWSMPSDLLVDCRRNLSEALDLLEARAAWWRLPAQLFRLRWLEAAALVSIGLALGVWVANQEFGTSPAGLPTIPGVSADAAVSNLRIIDADPASGVIELAGEMVSPMRLRGGLEDENIRRLLFNALSAPTNPGERLRVVEFLAPNARDEVVQEALIGALLHDGNPGVRLYALQGLKPFAAEDEVRTALLYALENDDNPGIRVEAIDALTPLTQEEAMEEVVQEATRADPNAYIRMRALQFVGR